MVSAAARPARTAASTTASGDPTKVTTVRLVARPGSTSSRVTSSTDSMASVIRRMTAGSRPSEKLGTHSSSGLAAMSPGYRPGPAGAERGRSGDTYQY